MSNKRKTALVVCPGRGTYNADELGYLARHHAAKQAYLELVDRDRASQSQEQVSALDGRKKFAASVHTRGDNASALINACAYCDFLDIDRDSYEIVAVTGNSLGWYIALGCADVVTEMDAARLVNTMGTLMQRKLNGGQLIYPLFDENWRPIAGRAEALEALRQQIDAKPGRSLHLSIELGGLILFGGDAKSLAELEKELAPEQGRFPLRLRNHAAFHTPLQAEVMEDARVTLCALKFTQPKLPLVDGRGKLWLPYSSEPSDLWDYTLGHQLVEPYRFTTAIQVAVKEFAPDCIINLGPGNTLGGAIAQSLIPLDWHGVHDKRSFLRQQANEAYILSMGIDEQRKKVVTHEAND
jgi:[acyl-carrier-protein] S-malonyltransferase